MSKATKTYELAFELAKHWNDSIVWRRGNHRKIACEIYDAATNDEKPELEDAWKRGWNDGWIDVKYINAV